MQLKFVKINIIIHKALLNKTEYVQTTKPIIDIIETVMKNFNVKIAARNFLKGGIYI